MHSYYSSRVPSGENIIVDAQATLFREAGHEVEVFAQHTDQRMDRRTYPVEAALTAATGVGPSPEHDLERFDPDVVHVHNLFPNFGTRWLSRWNGPLVATMHNYRPLCPAGSLFRDGHRCELCPTGNSAASAVKHRCFHGSRTATAPVALGTRFAEHPVLRRADLIAALSGGMAEVYEAYGVPREKLRVLENFAAAPGAAGPGGRSWLFAGRMEPEKGIHDLLASWPSGYPLQLAGRVDPAAPLPQTPDAELLGALPRDQLIELMAHARGLVFPSRWLEGMALVCIEALSMGTPVFTFDDIPAGKIVTETGAGLAVPRGELTDAVRRADDLFPRLRSHARAVYEERYSPDAWLARALELYREATERHSVKDK